MTPRTRLSIPSLRVSVADPSNAAQVTAALESALRAQLAGPAGGGMATDQRLAGAVRDLGGQVAHRARTGGAGR